MRIKESVIDMLLNNKCVYLGVSLFSAIILGAMSGHTVKAATTSPAVTSSSGTKTSPAQTTTSTTVTPTISKTASSTPTSTDVAVTAGVTPVTRTATTVTSTSAVTTTQAAIGTATSTGSTAGTTTSTGTASSTTGTTANTDSTTDTSSTSTGTASSTTGTTTSAGTTANTTGTTTGAGTTGTAATSTGTTGSTTGTTTSTATTPPTATDPYAIPSDVTDSTVVNFSDPLLENVVKYGLSVPANQDITVGKIKSFSGPNILIEQTNYQLNHPTGPNSTVVPGSSMTDQQDTPVESLNGMQYLQLLPAKTAVLFQVDLASDSKANEDLTPLDNLNFQNMVIDGNYSDPNAKEININQISDLNLSKASYVELTGDSKVSINSGLNNAELAAVAPTLTKFANNGQSSHLIELGQAQITDFTPLKGTETGNNVTIVSAPDTIGDANPVYAVDNQPISFTAPKIIGLNGDDIANSYHFTYNVPKANLADDDLTNLGNDKYILNNPSQGSTNLVYGNLGWAYSANPDAYVAQKVGNATFDTIITNIQPLIWQKNPTVTINYVDAAGKPLMINGSPMQKVLDGTTIGSPYDLTSDSNVAGYNLTSPKTLLKGEYTQDPQVIKLVYSPIPVRHDSSTTPVKTVTVTPKTREKVQIRDVTGNTTASSYLTDIGVKATAMINGKLFYQVGYGQLVEADDYDAVTSTTPGEVRTFGTKENLVDASGNPIDVTLSPNTAWKYDKIVSINGKGYYQVATNEFLPVASGVSFTPTVTRSTVAMRSAGPLYNSQGESLGTALPAGSSWATDGIAIINGVKMYRVASDEFVSADNATATEPITMQYRATSQTTLYDQNGQVITATLPADTTWKVDQIFYINGEKYYRVATNEYVKAA